MQHLPSQLIARASVLRVLLSGVGDTNLMEYPVLMILTTQGFNPSPSQFSQNQRSLPLLGRLDNSGEKEEWVPGGSDVS